MNHYAYVRLMQEAAVNHFRRSGYRTAPSGFMLVGHGAWRQNILVPEVADILAGLKTQYRGDHPFPILRSLYHGLSPHACCLNLFGPLILNRQYATLSDVLRLADPPVCLASPIVSVDLEHENRHALGEKDGQPTSAVLYITTAQRETVLVEFKFAEAGLGTCPVYESGDCDGANPCQDLPRCYLHAEKNRLYMDVMRQHQLMPHTEACPFTEFYQPYRLLLLALQEDESPAAQSTHVLLVHDARNPAFLRTDTTPPSGRYVRFKKMLTPQAAGRVSILSVQDIVAALAATAQCHWLADFRTRYALT